MANELIIAPRDEIVVYQPDDTTRLAVRFDGDTVWLSQEQMIDLFQRDRSVISRHINNAFNEGEVDKENCLQILQTNGRGRPEVVYNLEVVTSVGYRVKSLRGVMFRRWANKVLKDYLIHGQAINDRLYHLERRVEKTERTLEMVVRSALPAPEQVFVNGQFLDAHVELLKIVRMAKKRIVLVDNFLDEASSRCSLSAAIMSPARSTRAARTSAKPNSPHLATPSSIRRNRSRSSIPRNLTTVFSSSTIPSGT